MLGAAREVRQGRRHCPMFISPGSEVDGSSVGDVSALRPPEARVGQAGLIVLRILGSGMAGFLAKE